jgi:glycosyltransferase involved in cell wall biosynthesis
MASSMPNILLISPYWKEPHRWMVSSVKLAELWQRLGYRVVVVCMGVGAKSEKRTTKTVEIESVSSTLEIHRMRDIFFPDPWNYGIAFGFSGYVRRLVKEQEPDLIVVNKILFWSSLSVIALRLHGHRVIQLTDALVGMTWWPRGWVPRMCAALYAWTLGWLVLLCASKIVFFHSQPTALLRRLGIVEKSAVIPTGIDTDRFPPLPHSTSGGRRRGREVVVTYVGRLESVKGVDDFLAAVVPLTMQHTDLRVQVVGWYAESHPLVERYRHAVTFTGLRDDIPAILAGTDIFVLPSHSEGLSNALMEAMASGCACIASDVGGNRFLIQNGVSGFLYAPGDREALRAHIERLILDPAKRRMLGTAARRRIEDHFSWDKVGQQYDDLFRTFSPHS